MRAAINGALPRFLAAGVLALLAFGALSSAQARGGGGSNLYFPGITNFGQGAAVVGNPGGFEAQYPASVRPPEVRSHRVHRGNLSCDPYLTRPLPPYCQNQ